MKRVLKLLCVMGLATLQLNCAAGRRLGGVAGGLAGNVIGTRVDPFWGGYIGGQIGGAVGEIVGAYMDKQATELDRELKGAKVERIGDGIKLTFDATILFDLNRAEIKDAGHGDLKRFAAILNKYANTTVLVEGHTDASGSEARNLELSQQRAQAVADFLVAQEVKGSRLSVSGKGEAMPIADNTTAEGRAANRRVEVSIFADDELKKKADPRA